MKESRYQLTVHLIIWLLACGSIILLAILLDRSAHELDAFESRVNVACQSRFYDLDGAIRHPRPGEFRTVVRSHVLDSGILRLCLGSEYPVAIEDADTCWIKSSQEDCYRAPAEQLLGLYRRKFAEHGH